MKGKKIEGPWMEVSSFRMIREGFTEEVKFELRLNSKE